MTITEALKIEDKSIRVTCGFKWLVWNEELERWVVYGREPYQKKTRMLIVTEIENLAVEKLLED